MGLGVEVLRFIGSRHNAEHSYRGYHHVTGWDFAARGHGIAAPQELQPKEAPYVSMLAGSTVMLTMLFTRHAKTEKWLAGGLILTCFYFFAYKSHSVGNGMQGHSAAAWGSGLGIAGMCVRVMMGAGRPNINRLAMIGLLGCMWYDVGRHHLWAGYYARVMTEKMQAKRLSSPWTNFIRNPLDTELSFFTPLLITKEEGEEMNTVKSAAIAVAALASAVGAYVVIQGARRRALRTEEVLAAILHTQEEMLITSQRYNQRSNNPQECLFETHQSMTSAPHTPPGSTMNNTSADFTTAALSTEWVRLRDAVLALHGGECAPEESDGVQGVGTHVRVRRLADVQSLTLWDSSNNGYCSREGVVSRVDVDGDIRVDFEDGDFFICDASFLVTVGRGNEGRPIASPILLSTLWTIDRLIRKLRQGTVGISPGTVTPVHPNRSTTSLTNSLTPFSVMCAMTKDE